MAERRTLWKKISLSEQVNEMSEFAQLLFTWMIPHTNDYGIIQGTPRQIKAMVIPMSNRPHEDFEKALFEMKDNGLIYIYSADDKTYVQFVKFEQHQDGLHKRTKSKYPTYAEINKKEIPGNSGNIPESSGNVLEIPNNSVKFPPEVEVEIEQETELTIPPHNSVDNINTAPTYSEKSVGGAEIIPFELPDISEIIDLVPEKAYKICFKLDCPPNKSSDIAMYKKSGIDDPVINSAIHIAAKAHAKWSYVTAVLDRCKANKILTLDQFRADAADFEDQKKKSKGPPGTEKRVPQKGNFDQRVYSDDFYESLYDNV